MRQLSAKFCWDEPPAGKVHFQQVWSRASSRCGWPKSQYRSLLFGHLLYTYYYYYSHPTRGRREFVCQPETNVSRKPFESSLFGQRVTFLGYVSFPSGTKVSGKSLFRSREANLFQKLLLGVLHVICLAFVFYLASSHTFYLNFLLVFNHHPFERRHQESCCNRCFIYHSHLMLLCMHVVLKRSSTTCPAVILQQHCLQLALFSPGLPIKFFWDHVDH